jgi:hypothetical protein
MTDLLSLAFQVALEIKDISILIILVIVIILIVDLFRRVL